MGFSMQTFASANDNVCYDRCKRSRRLPLSFTYYLFILYLFPKNLLSRNVRKYGKV